MLYDIVHFNEMIIGASRSEPHTGDTNRDFPYVYIYISAVRPSVPYTYLFYFNDVHSVFFQLMRMRNDTTTQVAHNVDSTFIN